MTERIDLDDFEADESTAEDAKPRGSWFWEGDGDPDEEVDPWGGSTVDAADGVTEATETVDADERATDESESEDDDAADTPERDPIPRVPRTNEDRPVGIPMEGGGAGGTFAGAESAESTPDAEPQPASGDEDAVGTAGAADTETNVEANAGTGAGANAGADAKSAPESPSDAATATSASSASGPHGGGVDEMTLAFTYNAITRLPQLHGALADANEWTDWIGLVGDVEAYVINKFQRDNHLDLDFFNGSGTGPGERLAEIGKHSMFFAERMVVVGVEGEDEYVAEEAGWEFVSLADAAAKAGWDVDD